MPAVLTRMSLRLASLTVLSSRLHHVSPPHASPPIVL